jgi:hypothetical protein
MVRVLFARPVIRLLVATLAVFGAVASADAQVRLAPSGDTHAGPRETAASQDQPQAAPTPVRSARWRVELRGGFGLATNPSGGTGQLPGLGAVLSPASLTGGPVRAVSSWFFGDGAAQLNSIAASASPPGLVLPSLDAMLTKRNANRGSGGTVGVTISRDLSARLSADVSFDFNVQPLAWTSAATTAIEAARAGFIATWQPLLAAVSPAAAPAPVVTATTTGATSAGREIEASGTLTYRLRPGSRFDPFVVLGAGILANAGSTPSGVLTGNYDVRVVDPRDSRLPFGEVNQTDMVTIAMADGGLRPIGILGGGIDKALSAGSGLRFAARLAVGPNDAETTIDAKPTTTFGGGLFNVTMFNATTTIVLPVTLSGASLTGFKTFVGKGTRIESTITVGYFFRF